MSDCTSPSAMVKWESHAKAEGKRAWGNNGYWYMTAMREKVLACEQGLPEPHSLADAAGINSGAALPFFANQGTKGFSDTARLRRLERGEDYQRRGTTVASSGTRSRPIASLQSSDTTVPIANSLISKKGSVAPTINEGFSYTSTDSTVTWTWSGVIIRRADKTQEVIPDGSQTITGLSASSTYYFLPFWPPYGCCKQVGWVIGDSGSPQIAFSASPGLNALWQQNYEDREPLAQGAMSATTAAPSSTGTGGGGGSDAPARGGTCPRKGQVVHSRTRGVIPCESMHVGEHIESPCKAGWVRVKSIRLAQASQFVLVTTEDGEELETTLTTPQPLEHGGDCLPLALTLNSRVLVRPEFGSRLRAIELVDEPDMCVVVEMEGIDGTTDPRQHTFYCGWDEPNIATHNVIVKTT